MFGFVNNIESKCTMNRKDFLKNSLIAGAASLLAPAMLTDKPQQSTYDKLMDQVGFNHLPSNETKTMNSIFHPANSRGHANHGWLNSHHSFSFANYYNPERMHFGVLRVLNDDIVEAGKGFNTHPHDNMEIISIPLYGDLEHRDSMGNVAIIREGDVQVMSAGTGIYHSEFNKNADKAVKFLQIWVFPNKKNVTPRYDQISLANLHRNNEFYQILSPNANDQGVWIHQNAWFQLGQFDANQTMSYELRSPDNGVYTFLLDGNIEWNNQSMNSRDGLGVWNTPQIEGKSLTKSTILLMEVPMKL